MSGRGFLAWSCDFDEQGEQLQDFLTQARYQNVWFRHTTCRLSSLISSCAV